MRFGIGLGVGINRSNYAQGIFGAYATRVVADGGVVEAGACVDAVSSLLQSASLLLIPSGYKGGRLYSQIPTNGNGDLTWTRGSDAFRTNASGLIQRVPWNLALQSETFTNSIWSKNATAINTAIGASGIEGNVENAPNGTLTADRVNFNLQTDLDLGLQQNYSSAIASQSFVSSIYVKGEGSNIGKQIKLRIKRTTGGTFVAVDTTITLTADWVQITSSALTLLANNTGVQYIISSNDATNALIWGAQLVEGTTAQTYLPTTDRLNFPRLSYMYGSCPAVLLEPQRTNLAQNSGMTGGGSVPTGFSSFITGTTTAVASIKNNSVTAYRFSVTSQRAFFAQSLTTTIGTTYSLSIYCESVTTTQKIEDTISGGAVVAYYKNGVAIAGTTNIEAGNFYSMTLTASQVSTDIRIGAGVAGNITANVVLSMPQFEQGAYATTFILSPVGATATRVADSFSRSNIYTNGLITSSGGTWFVELRNNISYVRDNDLFWGIGDSAALLTNSLIFLPASNGRQVIRKYVGGTLSTLFTTTTTDVKIAIKWNGTNSDVFVNGVKVVSATAFTATQLQFLTTIGIGTPQFIQQMALFNTPLTDTQCQTLTTL